MVRGEDMRKLRLRVMVELDRDAFEDTYGVPATRAAIRDYVQQTLLRSSRPRTASEYSKRR